MSSHLKSMTINGERMEIPVGTTITAFLDMHNLKPKSVVVEVNKVIIERDKYGEVVLDDDD